MAIEEASPWPVFSELQKQADPASIDQSLAREEALNQILDEMVSKPYLDHARIHRRFASLRRNRAAKYLHRRHIAHRYGSPFRRRGGVPYGPSPAESHAPDVSDQLAIAELVGMVRHLLTREDFNLLLEIATGTSYSEIAEHLGISVPAIKTRIHRIREQVRLSPIGIAISKTLKRKH